MIRGNGRAASNGRGRGLITNYTINTRLTNRNGNLITPQMNINEIRNIDNLLNERN